ncbi:MAG: S1 RNA-binding domain-containing protein, partial [Candidatus Thiosymbion ectosymbiont of Robbea hypermnestra]|nr:S1 RNA-binding domain-containing protein [Candidatus Thiosymbion ectosymbiont of Robbea hypermnestra]
AGADWLGGREETPEWNFVWRFLLGHREELPEGIDAAALYRTGAAWLAGREETPQWAFVWQFLLGHRDEWPDGIEARALYRVGADWLAGREETPQWSHVWQFLLEHRDEWPDGIDAAALYRAGADWLGDREKTPQWAFVWQFLLGHREELPEGIDAAALYRTGADWLAGREETPEWNFVWRFLLGHRDEWPEGIDAAALYRTGADWLAGREDTPDWSHVWRFLLEHRDEWPEGIEAGALYRTGADWLAGREETPEWSFVWQFLLEHHAEWPPGIDAAALYRTGADWLAGREETPQWSYVWQFLLEHRDEWPDGIDAAALYRAGADWLGGREDTPDWSFVWQFLLEHRDELPEEIDAEALYPAGADWIRANRNQPQSPILAEKLLMAANPEAAWADELAGYLADWLTTHANQPIAGKMLHVMLKSGIAAGSEQPPPVPSPGWRQLANALRELTTAPRAFITDHAVGDIVTGKIAARAKKGYLVHLDDAGRVAAFLPGSKLGLTRPTDWDAPVGRRYDLEIIKIDPESLSIVVSRRAILERERRAAGDDPIAALDKGQVIEGTIANIRDFGLFVDIGGINGLLHRSRLADPPRGDLARSYSRGQRIRVRVIEVDAERNWISLAQHLGEAERQAREEAKQRLLDSFRVGQVLDGIIVNIVDYGLFVDLGGMDGLLHRSKLNDPSAGDLRRRFRTGAQIRVAIIKVNRARERIGLAEHPPTNTSG